jgi:UDP-N-acetylmuramoyl-tripeptide--D-alanyl-D-alanine ligase
MKIEALHSLFLECTSASTDTRKITADAMFFALKGENFDANAYAKEALINGARYVIIDNKDYFINNQTILVNNVLETLQKLATFHRSYLKLPIIALTGSNGKTTTKELINIVLATKYKTKATLGNLNNHIGVPLTLLSFTKETEIGIVEMGANHQKEIQFLCSIAQPDFGYITNFGKAHLEGFGGIEGVIKGKSEMYTYLTENNKLVFINADDEVQLNKTSSFNSRFTFSTSDKNADVFIEKVSADPFVNITTSGITIKSNLIGLYNATNINAALTIGTYFKVPIKDAKEQIESYTPDNNRSQLLQKNSNEIILDAYNANPSSMMAALQNFIKLDRNKKLIIIGDMYELGKESSREHHAIVTFLENKHLETYFIGQDFYANKVTNPKMSFFESFNDFSNFLETAKIENTSILIKGSRGMALERTLEHI